MQNVSAFTALFANDEPLGIRPPAELRQHDRCRIRQIIAGSHINQPTMRARMRDRPGTQLRMRNPCQFLKLFIGPLGKTCAITQVSAIHDSCRSVLSLLADGDVMLVDNLGQKLLVIDQHPAADMSRVQNAAGDQTINRASADTRLKSCVFTAKQRRHPPRRACGRLICWYVAHWASLLEQRPRRKQASGAPNWTACGGRGAPRGKYR